MDHFNIHILTSVNATLISTLPALPFSLTLYLFIFQHAATFGEMVKLNWLFLGSTKYLVLKEFYQLDHFQRALGGCSARRFFTEISYLGDGKTAWDLPKSTGCLHSHHSAAGKAAETE